MGQRQAHNSHGGRFAEDLLCKSPGYNNGNSPLFHWLQVVIDTGLLHSRPLIGKPPSMILVDVQVTGTCLCIRLVLVGWGGIPITLTVYLCMMMIASNHPQAFVCFVFANQSKASNVAKPTVFCWNIRHFSTSTTVGHRPFAQ